MKRLSFDVGAIALDGDGRVVLSDDTLDALAETYDGSLAGGTGDTNSGGCTNLQRCGGSTNTGGCSNTAGECVGSTNPGCKPPMPRDPEQQ